MKAPDLEEYKNYTEAHTDAVKSLTQGISDTQTITASGHWHETQSICPACGYCPCCGRSRQVQPPYSIRSTILPRYDYHHHTRYGTHNGWSYLMASLETDWSWLKAHIILLAVVSVLTFGSVFGIESLVAKHDAEVATRYQQIADASAKQNAVFQTQITAQLTQLANQNAALLQQNSQLATALSTREAVEKRVPVQTANLTVNQTATALNGTAVGENIQLSLPTAQWVLSQVQLVPLYIQDKVDLASALANETTVAANNFKQYQDEKTSHANDVATLNDKVKAQDKTISDLKSDCRKGKLKWFGIGYVAGFVSGIAVRL